MLCPPLRTAIGSSSSRAEADCRDHVVCARGADDELRVAVDHAVPDNAGVVVARIVAADDLPGELIGEAADRGGGGRHARRRSSQMPLVPCRLLPS